MTTALVPVSASFDHSKGYHLSYQTRLLSPQKPESSCTLRLRYLFPPDIYVDRYELEAQLSHSFWLNHTPDLELPVGVDIYQSWTELQVSLQTVAKDSDIVLNMPLHARYGRPAEMTHRTIPIPQPIGLWFCPSQGMHCISPLHYPSLTRGRIFRTRTSSAWFIHG